MKLSFPPIGFLHLAASSIFAASGLAGAQVLTLNFDGGNGTTSVDQYTGTAGSGWNTAWQTTFHSGITSGAATVSSASPLASGGGNYLQLTYDGANNTNLHTARTTRQINTSAISLTSTITLEFNIRSNTNLNSSTTQVINIFADSASAVGSSASTSWKIYGDQTGWYVFNNTTQTALLNGATGTGPVLANETWHFTLTIDPVTDKYSVSTQNLTTNSAVFSATNLSLRNTSDASLSYLNFNATTVQNITGQGFAIDSIVVVPEPGTLTLVGLGIALAGLAGRKGA